MHTPAVLLEASARYVPAPHLGWFVQTPRFVVVPSARYCAVAHVGWGRHNPLSVPVAPLKYLPCDRNRPSNSQRCMGLCQHSVSITAAALAPSARFTFPTANSQTIECEAVCSGYVAPSVWYEQKERREQTLVQQAQAAEAGGPATPADRFASPAGNSGGRGTSHGAFQTPHSCTCNGLKIRNCHCFGCPRESNAEPLVEQLFSGTPRRRYIIDLHARLGFATLSCTYWVALQTGWSMHTPNVVLVAPRRYLQEKQG